jgi:hypothetical protein
MWTMQRAVLLWMMNAADRDAVLLYDSMSGLGTKDTTLIGIVCTRTPSQLYIIKQAYYNLYHRTLEHAIDADTSGNYRKVRSYYSSCHATFVLNFVVNLGLVYQLEVDRKVELQLLVFHLRRDLSIFFPVMPVAGRCNNFCVNYSS